MKPYYVYILASKRNGTLYTGVTNDIVRRVFEHKSHINNGFTDRYDVTKLVWYEKIDGVEQAIEWEKKIKNRNRAWKIALIEERNPQWNDLAEALDSATCAQNDTRKEW